MIDETIASVERKKAQLDALRPLSASAMAQLRAHYDVDLIFSALRSASAKSSATTSPDIRPAARPT